MWPAVQLFTWGKCSVCLFFCFLLCHCHTIIKEDVKKKWIVLILLHPTQWREHILMQNESKRAAEQSEEWEKHCPWAEVPQNHKRRPSTIFSFWMRVFNYLFLHSFVCLLVRYSWDIIFSFCVHAAPHPLTTNQPCAAQIIWLPESPGPSAIRLTGGVALIIAVWWRW